MFVILKLLLIAIILKYSDGASKEKSKLEQVIKEELLSKLRDPDENQVDLVEPDHKIIGGWSATTGLVPYQVYINAFIFKKGSQECGGSLISRSHILTAAHCLYGTIGSLVLIGASNKNEIFGPGVTSHLIDWQNYILHPDYDDNNLTNDIALMRLPENVDITFTINLISLPTEDMTDIDYFAGMKGVISGFGKTSDMSITGSNKLQMSHVNITTYQYCQRFWSRIYDLQETQICTRFEGSGTCSGDSGGPLAVAIGDKKYLVGITSFGASRCEKRAPSVYTNVASYIYWIESIINLI